MSRFRNTETEVVVSVDDSKDARFASANWEKAAPAESKPAPKKTAAKSDSK